MGIVLNWNSTYPGGGIDDTTINFPVLTDTVHDVMASHVNSLAAAVIALQTAVGINGGLTVREADLTPSVVPVHTIVFSNGSVTDLGSGVVQVVVGGGGSVSPFPFTPTTADLDTEVVIGTITSVSITDVAGSTIGFTSDLIRVTATAPQAGSSISIPILIPVTPLPDKFSVKLSLFTGAPPSVDFLSALAFIDSSGDLSWNLLHSCNAASTTRSAFSIVDIDTGVTNATWQFPDLLSHGNALNLSADIEKVAPFTATPQIRISGTAGTFVPANNTCSSAAFTNAPTSGTISAGWAGEDFESASLLLFFPNTAVGTLDLFISLTFLPHVEDR